MICNAARASRPGLAVGLLRVLCKGMCAAQRFYMDDEEHKCRAGCQDEPDSLSHDNECPLCTTSSPRFGGTLQFKHGEAILSTTLLPRSFQEAFNMESS